MGIPHLVAISGDDDDQKKVDTREQERVDDEPDLTEDCIEMLLVQL